MFVNRLEFSLLIGQCDVSCELCVNLKHLTLASHATAWIWSLFERNNYLKKKCTQNDISVIIYSRRSEPVEQVPRILKLYDSFVSGTNRNAKTPTHLWNLICIYRLSQVRRHIELNKAERDKLTQSKVYLSGLTSAKNIANWHVRLWWWEETICWNIAQLITQRS